jgi:mevalonate kinase
MRHASACAKFILGGEHSIVDRGQALCIPLKNKTLEVKETLEPGLFVNDDEMSGLVFEKIQELRKLFGAPSTTSGLSIHTDIPIGAGLGSSAALCTALARMYGRAEGQQLAEMALSGERFFHGNPSGIDPYTVSLEKPLVFGHDKNFRGLDTRSFDNSNLCFVLKDSKLRHNTIEIIHQVKHFKEKSFAAWDSIMKGLSENAFQMIEAFEKVPSRLGSLMSDSHKKLQALGVSNSALDSVVEELLKCGALGAKLTGAGGGGFALGLFTRAQAQNAGLDICY